MGSLLGTDPAGGAARGSLLGTGMGGLLGDSVSGSVEPSAGDATASTRDSASEPALDGRGIGGGKDAAMNSLVGVATGGREPSAGGISD